MSVAHEFPATAAKSLVEGYCQDFVSLAASLAQTLEQISMRSINVESCRETLARTERGMRDLASAIQDMLARGKFSSERAAEAETKVEAAPPPPAPQSPQSAQSHQPAPTPQSAQSHQSPPPPSRPLHQPPQHHQPHQHAQSHQQPHQPPQPQQHQTHQSHQPHQTHQHAHPHQPPHQHQQRPLHQPQPHQPQHPQHPQHPQPPQPHQQSQPHPPQPAPPPASVVRAPAVPATIVPRTAGTDDPAEVGDGECAIRGTTKSMPLLTVFQFLCRMKKSGRLSVRIDTESLTFDFVGGSVEFTTSDNPPDSERLGDILLRLYPGKRAVLEPVLKNAGRIGVRKLGAILVQEGVLSNGQVVEGLERQVHARFHRAITSPTASYEFDEGERVPGDGRIRIRPFELLFESRRIGK